MRREEIIQHLTLRAIADDYENFDRILRDVKRWAATRGFKPRESAILKALDSLIQASCARAYSLSEAPGAKPQIVPFRENRVDELWFYVTPKGKRLVRALMKYRGDRP